MHAIMSRLSFHLLNSRDLGVLDGCADVPKWFYYNRSKSQVRRAGMGQLRRYDIQTAAF